MGEDKNFLSQESIQKLSKTISEAKNLAGLQLEILEKVLAVEEKIAQTRIGYLNEFHDTYYKGLDMVAKKQSQLEEGYLVLNHEAEKFVSNISSDNGVEEMLENELAAIEELHERETQIIDDEKRAKILAGEEVTEEKISQAKKLSDFVETQARLARLNQEEADNEIEKTRSANDIYEATRAEKRRRTQQTLAEQDRELENSIIALHNLRHQDEVDKADQLTALRISNLQEVTDAETSAQKLINEIRAQQDYSSQENYKGTEVNEAGATRAKQAEATAQENYLRKLQENRAAYIKRRELELARKNGGVLEKEAATQIQKEAAMKFKLDEENLKKLAAKEQMLDEARRAAEEREDMRRMTQQALKGGSTTERYDAIKKLTTDEDGSFNLTKALTAAALAVSDFAKQLKGTIDEIAGKKGAIDTRLQGSNNEKYAGSYWDQLVRDMTSVGAVNPFFKQEDFAKNIESLVKQGIAFDIKQRAFLMTVQSKIADTFDATNATLLRLVRIQQEDSTAGRLGMESALNAFLNNMYETSEYLSDVASSVRSSLEEMESLMAGAEATEVEYQVQKWLGSLYSVGMSQNATQGIADALGKIAAGQIEGLTNGGAGNLLIMAANDAGLSIADILTDGINAEDTNKLLQAAVNYLAELADSAEDNKVVQQQLADVFGVRASDLRAATNLVIPGTTASIYESSLSYNDMLGRLSEMAGSMYSRTSMAEMMSNIWENGKYTLAGGIASNPVSYLIYNMAALLDDAAGGIDLPFLNVMGFGVDLNTTVSDLMRVAALGTGILGSLGPMISGLGSSFSGRAMLNKLDIGTGSGLAITPRGDGSALISSAGGGNKSTSGSGYVGNASGNDVKDSTIQESEDSKKQQMIEAKEEAEANQVDVLNTTVVKMYELLEAVASGKSSFNVRVEGYGLTKASSGAQGGVSALGNDGSSGGGGNNILTATAGSVNSSGVSGSVTLGGWTTT